MEQNSSEKEGVVIGWGLTGVVLSWQLYFQNRNFQVFDSLINYSTRAAAGMVNPMVFKRLNKSWKADTLVPYAHAFYSKIEKELGVQLLSGKQIYRVFASVEEQNNWSSKQGDERYSHYLNSPKTAELPNPDLVAYPYGLGKVNTFGNLNTNLFLDASKAFFQSKGIQFKDEVFDYAEIDSSKLHFFCEGAGLIKNPLFNQLPLNATQGETLIIETDELDFDHTINKNMFVMRIGEKRYKVGATYNWTLKKPITTAEGKAELLERLDAFTSFNYKVVDHQAGIRPTAKDRRPMLGRHFQKENAIVFNAMGSKGVMISPFYAAHLLEHIFNGAELDSEVDIKRFASEK